MIIYWVILNVSFFYLTGFVSLSAGSESPQKSNLDPDALDKVEDMDPDPFFKIQAGSGSLSKLNVIFTSL